jgi:hypothetical protein
MKHGDVVLRTTISFRIDVHGSYTRCRIHQRDSIAPREQDAIHDSKARAVSSTELPTCALYLRAVCGFAYLCHPCLVCFKIGQTVQNANFRGLRNLWYVSVDLVVLSHVMGEIDYYGTVRSWQGMEVISKVYKKA